MKKVFFLLAFVSVISISQVARAEIGLECEDDEGHSIGCVSADTADSWVIGHIEHKPSCSTCTMTF